MLEQYVGVFLSKVMEKFADGTLSRPNFQETLESLKRSLNRLSKKEKDVLNQVKNAELLGEKKRKGEVELWLDEVQKLESEIGQLLTQLETEGFIRKFIRKFFGGDKFMKLLGKVNELLEQSRDLDYLFLDVSRIPAVPFLSGRLVGEKFEENFSKIWNILVVDGVSSIAIQGMGGGGKTTLAKSIHDQLLKEPHYEAVFWITVSQTFSIKNLQDEIARHVDLNLLDERNEDIRAARLKQFLSLRKNFVLILDDVWNNINLKKLGDPLSVLGGKLIITTRSTEVSDQIGCKKVVRVTALSESESWDLFKMNLGEEIALTPQIQEIAKYLAQKCSGLPLAIISAARSMKGKSDIHEWRNAEVELNELIMRGRGDEDKKVFEILKYSFDQLDQGEEKHGLYTKLQHCFLYCCLYPEDKKMNKKELIELFISETMLDTTRSRRKQVDQGHVMLNKLVNVCLLESDEKREWVKMHNVIRAMALKITEGRYMRINRQQYVSKECWTNEFWTEEMEKVSLMEISTNLAGSKSSLLNIPAEWTPNCPKLTTLFLQRNDCFEVIPRDSFFWMHNLHVLNLSSTRIKELPGSLSNLKGLRSLLLQSCYELKCVPYLGNLKELRELNLSNSSIQEVPRGMEELTNLECLKIDAPDLKLLPRNLLANFRKLECLHLPFHIVATIEEIERLKQLEEFHGRVKDVSDLMRLMGIHPRFKEHTRSYCVAMGESRPFSHVKYDKAVKMCGTHLTEEGWAIAMSLAPDIQSLGLYKCTGLSDCLLEDLRQLNVNVMGLEILDIWDCKGIECISKQEQFPTEEATLNHPFNLKQERMMELKRFSSLKQLLITGCHEMKTMGLPMSELENLEVLAVLWCSKIEEIIDIADEHGVGNQAQHIVDLPKLKVLRLGELPRLKTICKATVVCTSIESIDIRGCSGVEKLPMVFGHPEYDSPPSALQSIYIVKSEQEWWESLKLVHPSLHGLLKPFIRMMPRMSWSIPLSIGS